MSNKEAKAVERGEFVIIDNIARLFGPLYVPLFVALLCLQSRPLFLGDLKLCCDRAVIGKIYDRLRSKSKQPVLEGVEAESGEALGEVIPKRFPVVKQWVRLYGALLDHHGTIPEEAKAQAIQRKVCSTLKTQTHDF